MGIRCNDIANFPKAVVDLMLIRQKQQTGKTNIEIFKENRMECDAHGGFLWTNTPEEHGFWEEVIERKNFDVFYEKYPREDMNKGETLTFNKTDKVITLLKKMSFEELVKEVAKVVDDWSDWDIKTDYNSAPKTEEEDATQRLTLEVDGSVVWKSGMTINSTDTLVFDGTHTTMNGHILESAVISAYHKPQIVEGVRVGTIINVEDGAD
jgi:hypothetical protein